jgi:hypothetical protein
VTKIHRWLIRGETGSSDPNDMAAAPLKLGAYWNGVPTGGNMTTQTNQDARYPICERTQRMQDILLASSFGLWAGVLGLGPALAFRLLAGS